MRVSLPDDAEIIICKDAGEKSLVVESNLAQTGSDPRDVAAFRFDNGDGTFTDGGTALHDYIEDHLAKHLKVQLDLEPQVGQHAKKSS